MSNAQLAVANKYAPVEEETGPTTLTDDETIQEVLTALEDHNCRRILEATAEETLTASEISDRCDMPLSTTYRKLNTLEDLSLLSSSIRLRTSGRHTQQYARAFDDVTVVIDDENGVILSLSDV